ncbi:MAG: flagellar biosynthesis protein FlhF [Deltaproteobacteria bacterium GWA2_55_10]|nr:MAG: flagellar biosynthesis protein FlhF [Deltaproteobacteria bacterium GWA2_55_10]
MRIKRFTGPSVKDAMKDIKAEFGANALILSTKKVGVGVHEVVAAVDYDLSAPVDLSLSTAPRALASPAQRAAADAGTLRLPEELSELRRELRELKELKNLCMNMVTSADGPLSDVFTRLEENLVSHGIDRRLAKKILMNTLSGVTREKATDVVFLKNCIKKKVYDKIAVSDPLASKGVVAFVGSSGVGKTTTIAKLAALNALRKKKRTALITTDTYRIGAVEQLKIYGRLMGVPVEVAKDTNELRGFIKAHNDKDLVLIDTAGRNQNDIRGMNELKAFADAVPGIKFNLVLNSQSRDEALYSSVKGFSALPLDSLSFTRLDEGSSHGPILNAMVLAKKPIAYLSTGSRVPEDIEAASRERLMQYIMPN